jgi:hypothetical protein
MKTADFWVVAPRRLVELHRRFRGTHWLHLQGDEELPGHFRTSSVRNPVSVGPFSALYISFLYLPSGYPHLLTSRDAFFKTLTILMTEAPSIPETSVNLHQTTRTQLDTRD